MKDGVVFGQQTVSIRAIPNLHAGPQFAHKAEAEEDPAKGATTEYGLSTHGQMKDEDLGADIAALLAAEEPELIADSPDLAGEDGYESTDELGPAIEQALAHEDHEKWQKAQDELHELFRRRKTRRKTRSTRRSNNKMALKISSRSFQMRMYKESL